MRRTFTLCLLLTAMGLWAQQLSMPHGLYTQLMTVTITPSDGQAEIRYTLDGSEPTMESPVYRKAIVVSKTTVVRAGEVDGDTIRKPVVTATYVYPQSVMSQPNDPEGYPDHWGRYAQMRGTAPADYEMDPELTTTSVYRKNIRECLYELPLLSLVTDKDYFFGLEEDEQRGGIYIYTGAPVGSGVGRGWERPVSMELIGGPQQHDLTVDCVVKIHGGHGRLPEKNPKHSLRLTFKDDYGGPGKLRYPLFGERGVGTFNALVLRAMFGNSWQHWDNGQRRRAQYCRDLWTRQMQRQLGHPFADGIYVHLFINGLYWGIYNIAERIDDNYCKEHFGGKKSDYDVVKVDETNGNRTEAGDGDLDKWNEMLAMVRQAAYDDRSYYRLQGMNGEGERDARKNK